YRFCTTAKDYDVNAGETWSSVGGTVTSHKFSMVKRGHMRLESTNALQELFVDRSGNPVIGPNSAFSSVGDIGTTSGAHCQLDRYTMEGETVTPMRIQRKVNTD